MTQNEARLIVLEKLKTYTSETRGLNHADMCTYLNEEGRSCIAGAFMDDPAKAKKIADETFSGRITNPKIFECLNKIGKKAGMEFMAEMQLLHDDKKVWSEYGLNDWGNQRVNAIIKDFKIKTA